MIQIMRTLPAQNMLSTFSQHSLEAHIGYNWTDFIWVNQTRVTEYLRRLVENLLNLYAHAFHFFTEAVFICQWRKTMWIRLAEEFTATCIVQLMQQFDNYRSMNFQLFQCYSRNRECYLECASIGSCHFNQRIQRRNIRTLNYFVDALFVGIVIIIIVVGAYLEETITFQMDDLMYLKVKTDCFHI